MYEDLLRVLTGQYTFGLVKRFLLLMNISIDDTDMAIVQDSRDDTHFILGEMILTLDKVVSCD
jgi:hypothetical protein